MMELKASELRFIFIPGIEILQTQFCHRKNAMKQSKRLRSILGFALIALALLACTFTVEVMPTATPLAASPTLEPIALPTGTSIPLTFEPAMPTPTLISIRPDTLYLLEISSSFKTSDVIRSVAFSPDGSILAAAGGNNGDFSVHLWDVASGQPLGTLDGHTGIIWAVVFSPDGQLLASVSADRTAKIWDWRNKMLIKSLDFPGQVCSVSFSPDGQTLAVGGVDTLQNQIQNAAVWTFVVGSWQPIRQYPEFVNVVALGYSPKGGTLLGGGTSANIQVWRTSDGARLFTLNHAHQVSKAVISPDGSTVATATCINVVNYECTEGGIWLWDLPTGKLNRKLTGFPDAVAGLAFAADGSTLVAGSRNGTLRFYSTADYTQLFDLSAPGGIETLAVSPGGGLLATGNSSGDVHIWKNIYRP